MLKEGDQLEIEVQAFVSMSLSQVAQSLENVLVEFEEMDELQGNELEEAELPLKQRAEVALAALDGVQDAPEELLRALSPTSWFPLELASQLGAVFGLVCGDAEPHLERLMHGI